MVASCFARHQGMACRPCSQRQMVTQCTRKIRASPRRESWQRSRSMRTWAPVMVVHLPAKRLASPYCSLLPRACEALDAADMSHGRVAPGLLRQVPLGLHESGSLADGSPSHTHRNACHSASSSRGKIPSRAAKASRARMGHLPPAVSAIATRGRQLSVARSCKDSGRGGSPVARASRESCTQR